MSDALVIDLISFESRLSYIHNSSSEVLLPRAILMLEKNRGGSEEDVMAI
jgi:hypothetical protein